MTGLEQKQLGLALTESNNKALVNLARAVAKEICGRVGKVSIDDVRSDPRMIGLEPTSPNFWGSVWNEKGWVCIDRKYSERRSNNHREIKVWRYQGE